MIQTPVPFEDYWQRRNQLDRTVIDLQDAERDLTTADEAAEVWYLALLTPERGLAGR